MKRKLPDSCHGVLMISIPFVLVFLFFSLVEPSHIRFQEQYQMFLFTTDYLKEVMSFPGGPAVYAGRFFTQFFIHPLSGALVIALLLWLVQSLTLLTMGGKGNTFVYALSFIPSVILALYMCDENAFLSTIIAVALGLALAYPIRNIRKKSAVAAVATVLSATIYFIAGNIGVVAFSAAVFVSCRDFRIGLGCLAAGLACTFVSRYFCDYPFIRLLTGPHYNRYHDVVPVLPWLSVLSLCFIAVVTHLFRNTPGKSVSILCYVTVIVSLVSGLALCRDRDTEELMTYISLTQREDWDGILKQASKMEPIEPISISCVNLALAKTGYLGEWMFRFRQNGNETMFYPYRREHISPIPASMIYWNLGLVNTCERFTFAAQEVIPDYQKSSWCHKRLTEVFMVNGEYDIARKYLEPLKYTLFYRSWARRTESLLDNPGLIDSDDTYGQIRKLMLKHHDCTYAVNGLYRPLHYLCLENNANTVAYQYLLGLDLLEKDLDRFAEHFNAQGFNMVPTAFQEAYILCWSMDHSGPEGIPSFIKKSIIDRFMRFSSEMNAYDKKTVWKRYSDTYWFYYFFRNKQ